MVAARAYFRRRRPVAARPASSVGPVRRQRYAAAQLDHLTGDWVPLVADVNELIAGAAPRVRGRVAQLVRDFPPFHRAVNNLVGYTVGTGVQLQSQVRDDDGKPLHRARKAIEEAWKYFMDEADLSGGPAFRQHFHELAGLAKRQDVEAGEFIAAIVRHPEPRNRFLPFGLAFYESERLTDLGARPRSGNLLHHGVEYSPLTGAIEALHIADAERIGAAVRVPAEDALFGFLRFRPGQLRGMTPFAPAVLLTRALGEAIGAEVDAFQLASKWLAIVTTQDPKTFQASRVTEREGRRIEQLENAIIEYLRPGESIELKNNQRGDEAFQSFAGFILRMVSITIDVPYEILTMDYRGLNYSTMRVGRNDFSDQIAPIQRRHVLQFYDRVFRRFLDESALRGRLDLPGYWRNPWRYRECLWIPPGMKPIDPLRETKAAVDAMGAYIASPQEFILARGQDPERVLDDIAEWRRMCEERGLDWRQALGGVNTALASNPAAVSGEGGESGDEDEEGRMIQ